MAEISDNTVVDLDGQTSFSIGAEVYNWGQGDPYIRWIDVEAYSGGPFTVDINLAGGIWSVSQLYITGSSIAEVTLTDTSQASFDHIVIEAITSTNLSFSQASFDYLEIWGGSADTLQLGSGEYQFINLGDGADTVTMGASGVGLLRTGSGEDMVTINDANNYTNDIDTGDDDDTVTVSAGGVTYLTTGSGNDQVQFTGNSGADQVNVEDGENSIYLEFSNEDAGIDSLMAYEGNDYLETTGVGFLQTVNLGDGNNIIRSGISTGLLQTGDGNDQVDITNAYLDTIRLSDGTNNITITGIDEDTFVGSNTAETGDGDDTVTVQTYASIQYLVMNGGTNKLDVLDHSGVDMALFGNQDDTITVDATSDIRYLNVGEGTNIIDIDGSVDTIKSWEGSNTVTVADFASVGTISLGSAQGTSAVNSVSIGKGTYIESVSLGAGNDTVTVDEDTWIDSLVLGRGQNNVTLIGNGMDQPSAGASVIRSNNANTVLNLQSGAYVDSILLFSNSSMLGQTGSTVNAAGGASSILFGRANDTLNISSDGLGYASMGQGDDVINISDLASAGASALVMGNDGTDTVSFKTFSVGVTISLETALVISMTTKGMFAFAGIERLIGSNFADTLTGSSSSGTEMRGAAGADTYIITNALNVVNETGGNGIDTVKSDDVSINLSLGARFIGTIENAALFGTDSLDLTGNNGQNTLTGNGGENVIDGKLGIDTLIGGAGNDNFQFSSTLGAGNIDKVNGYNVADDRIQLDNAIFTALANGAVLKAQFESNDSGLATKLSTRLIYEADTGDLIYDSNGSKAGGVHQTFATISPNLVMNEGEFWVI